MSIPWRRTTATGALLAGVVLVAGCSGTGGSTSGSVAGGASAEAVPNAPSAAAGFATRHAAKNALQPAALTDRSVVRTGEIEMTSRHPQRVRQRLDGLLHAFGGAIDEEQTMRDTHGRVTSSHLVIRVPVGVFGTAFEAFQRLGDVRHADTTSKDVTSDVIDTRERIETLTNSLSRLMKFQREATNVRDLLRFENAITERRAELQSLRGQRDYLHSQTTKSTIDLYLSRPRHHVAPPPPFGHAGFLTGLRNGWHAFTTAVLVVLTGLGAAIPFMLLVVLLGVPAWFLVRRSRGVHVSLRESGDSQSNGG